MAKTLTTDKAHTQYKIDGVRVPGVTTITGVLNKPALVRWANRMGLDGIDTTKYVDNRAAMGTLAHNMVEAFLLGEEADTSEYSAEAIEAAENATLSFHAWAQNHKYKVIDVEMKMLSRKWRIGGTCDIYWILDDVYTLTDLKTGKGIYPDHKCQAMAYAQIMRENGLQVDRVGILNIPRDEDERFAYEEIAPEDEAIYTDIFEHCLAIYNAKKKLRWY
jgi:hypothetical protein